ncbi:hypothetical protein MTQ01_23260 [Streptomyces sp. XM4193]|uniref:hypothetical protein n=1 Tax=Streptomyces sp. XM4193 TaxID=2929782 RepID=UPI001FFB55BE|nr:hypothetical protein [Streptomyces sp. XM4193]MCK1798890.1 hypothetical protein [Streptomyces sp. XM4193]
MSTPTYPPQAGGWTGDGGWGAARPGRPSHLPSPEPDAAPAQLPGQRRSHAGFGLRGPRGDRHLLPKESLGQLSLPVGDDGIVIGVDPQNQPAVLSLLRPKPLDVLLVGSLWIAQLLALRAVAVGARVAVETARAPAWTQMAQAAGGGQQSVSVHDVRQIAPQGPSVSSPVLVVRDCGAQPPRNQLAPSPWQGVATVLPFLGPKAPRLLNRADLVGLQRLSPQETEVVARVMRLPRQVAATIPTLSDNALLWCTKDHQQFVLTEPTDAETGLLGAPRRMD